MKRKAWVVLLSIVFCFIFTTWVMAGKSGIWKPADESNSFFIQTYSTGSCVVIVTPDGEDFYVFLDSECDTGVEASEYFGRPASLDLIFISNSTATADLVIGGKQSEYTLSRLFEGDCRNDDGNGFKDNIRFEANAATVNAGAGTLTLGGLAGITVTVEDTLTEFKPAGSTLNDIVLGNEVKIRAREGAGGSIVAIELEIMNAPSDRAIIQGTVDSFVPSGDVTILGVVVDTTTIENDDFKDHDVIIGRAEFFNRLAVGDLVKARLDLSTGNWDQIEFED